MSASSGRRRDRVDAGSRARRGGLCPARGPVAPSHARLDRTPKLAPCPPSRSPRPTAPRAPGVLRTAHGEVRTPAFMPVGTKGDGQEPRPGRAARGSGSQIILGNTYHLHFRPGDELIAELGGLHAFSGWDGPILTDSGGFQVFSLRDTLLEVDDDGVTFRSVYDGAPARFTPELAARDPAATSAPTSRCASTSARLRACREPSSRRPCGARRSGRRASGECRRAPTASSSSGSRRAPPTPSSAALDRGDHRARLRRLRARRAGRRREPGGDVRRHRLGGAAAARRAAALLHGDRRRRGRSCA